MSWSDEMLNGFALAHLVHENAPPPPLSALMPSIAEQCQERLEALAGLEEEERNAQISAATAGLLHDIRGRDLDWMPIQARMWLARHVDRRVGSAWLKEAGPARRGFRPSVQFERVLLGMASKGNPRQSPTVIQTQIDLGRRLFSEGFQTQRTQEADLIRTKTALGIVEMAPPEPSTRTFRDAMSDIKEKKASSRPPPEGAASPQEATTKTAEPETVEAQTEAEAEQDPATKLETPQAKPPRDLTLLVDVAMALGDQSAFLRRLGALRMGWDGQTQGPDAMLRRGGRELRILWESKCLESSVDEPN